MSLRQDLITSAVSFLTDPTVASSPLAKRLQFLESKGLTPPETDEALRRAAAGSPAGASASGGGLAGYYQGGGGAVRRGRYGQPEEIGRDWRDWFVMTVIGGGVGYLVISLAKKYLFPALQPPSQTELEAAQAALTAKYDEAASILASLQADTGALKEDFAKQVAKVDGAVEEVHDAIDECMKGELERVKEMDKVKDEVEALKEMLPGAVSSGTGSTAFAGLGSRPPGIPAWQLAAAGTPAQPKAQEISKETVNGVATNGPMEDNDKPTKTEEVATDGCEDGSASVAAAA